MTAEPLRDVPPPIGIAELRAGVSCAELGEGHDRTVIVAPTYSDLWRRMQRWRCRCGRSCFGERQPAGRDAGRTEETPPMTELSSRMQARIAAAAVLNTAQQMEDGHATARDLRTAVETFHARVRAAGGDAPGWMSLFALAGAHVDALLRTIPAEAEVAS